jgi:regulator of sigma E protease
MVSFLIFALILSSLVVIHELGHFWAARKMGVKVEEFGLGIPPKLFGRKYKGTEYTFNALPIGGFVRLKGEEVHNSDSDSFESKSPAKRAFIIVAGVLMNLILAVVIFQGLLLSKNNVSDYLPLFPGMNPIFGKFEVTPGVFRVDSSSKIDVSKLSSYDYIYSVNGNQISNNEQISKYVNESTSNSVNLVLKNLKDTSIVKELEVETLEKDGKKYLGLYLSEVGRINYQNDPVVLTGVMHSVNMTLLSFNALGTLFSKAFEEKDPTILSAGVGGPVRIYGVVDAVNQESSSVVSDMLNLVAILSLSLAVMNILPIPAVDGGRLVFVLVELIARRRINPEIEMTVNKFGMFFLLVLIVLITYSDITLLFFSN